MFIRNNIIKDLDILNNEISKFFSGADPFQVRYDYPLVNVSANSENIAVQVEVPGLKKEDLDISITNDILNISGEIKSEKAVDDKIVRNERFYGKFNRSIELPHEVNADKATANIVDGILTIVMPVAEDKKAKKIEIK